MAGEGGLKQRAKTLDGNLFVIVHDILNGAVQRNLEEVLALSDSLTSLLLCKEEVHHLGLKVVKLKLPCILHLPFNGLDVDWQIAKSKVVASLSSLNRHSFLLHSQEKAILQSI